MTHDPTSATIALVTGANKGIGREIAAGLAVAGATVLLGCRDLGRGDAAAAELTADGADVHVVPLDVADDDQVLSAAAWIDERFGRLDVLVNNAGISGARSRAPSTADLTAVRAVYATNVFGLMAVTNAMVPLLRRSAHPRVVNVSSSVGSFAAMTDPASPTYGFTSGAYAPSKSVVNALTIAYAKDLRADRVLVNAACPGYCATDLNGHGGHRTPAEGARTPVRLALLDDDGPTGGFFDDDGPVAR